MNASGNQHRSPFFISNDGRFINLINEQENAGGCLAFRRDNILGAAGQAPDAWPVLERLAAQMSPGRNGVVFTPWLYGERTPVEDRLIRGY